MATPQRIPLFPLDTVLFPEMALPLHIFEPRYKIMIRDCLRERLEFGIVLAKEDGIAGVGCTASIVEVTREYEDSRMDILTQGRRVYNILSVYDEHPYYEAQVEFRTEPGAGELGAIPELEEIYEQCHALFYGTLADLEDLRKAVSVAYYIASDMPLDNAKKQAILEINGEAERRGALIEWMRELLPSLQERYLVREKARGNGHRLN